MTILRKHWLFGLSAALLLAVTGAWAQHDTVTGENSILTADEDICLFQNCSPMVTTASGAGSDTHYHQYPQPKTASAFHL